MNPTERELSIDGPPPEIPTKAEGFKVGDQELNPDFPCGCQGLELSLCFLGSSQAGC